MFGIAKRLDRIIDLLIELVGMIDHLTGVEEANTRLLRMLVDQDIEWEGGDPPSGPDREALTA